MTKATWYRTTLASLFLSGALLLPTSSYGEGGGPPLPPPPGDTSGNGAVALTNQGTITDSAMDETDDGGMLLSLIRMWLMINVR